MKTLFNESALPVIGIGSLRDGNGCEIERSSCIAEIRRACIEYGCFYVYDHGIDECSRVALFEAAIAFFSLPPAVKQALSIKNSAQFRGYTEMLGEITAGQPDWHECLDIQPLASRLLEPPVAEDGHVLDDPGQWPAGLPDFRQAMIRSWDDRLAMARRLVRGLALSLGLSIDYFDRFHGLDLCDLRLSHYPAVVPQHSGATALGMNAHVDLGFLAILDQDENDGLEVLIDGTWRAIPFLSGTYIVNIGLMMQRWTNDLYQAPWHRVRLSRQRSRYAAPFFYEPRPDAVIEPLAICCGPDAPAAYAASTVGDYFDTAFTKAYRAPPNIGMAQ